MKSLKYVLWITIFLVTNISAAPLLTETETPYPISGSTADQLRIEMNKLAPEYQGKHYDAHTTWYVKWSYDYQSENNVCRFIKSKVTVDIHYYFPQWVDEDKADPVLKAKWDNYLKQLQVHEQGHAENGKNAATEIETMLNELTPMEKCQELSAIANNKAQQIIFNYNNKDIQYDNETQHGITQGAVF